MIPGGGCNFGEAVVDGISLFSLFSLVFEGDGRKLSEICEADELDSVGAKVVVNVTSWTFLFRLRPLDVENSVHSLCSS